MTVSRRLVWGLGIFLMFFAGQAVEAKTVTPPLFKKTVENVHFNWGSGGPAPGLKDHFTARFTQTRVLDKGDYFTQTLADDGVRFQAGKTKLIDRWTPVNGKPDRKIWTNVAAGKYTFTTDYLENTKNAAVFADVVKLGSWLAYYYPNDSNDSLSGFPTNAQVIPSVDDRSALNQKIGLGSPMKGLPVGHYSGTFTTAKRLPAGDYVIRMKADDGVRVYVDDNKVKELDRWQQGANDGVAVKISIQNNTKAGANEQNIHWIRNAILNMYSNA